LAATEQTVGAASLKLSSQETPGIGSLGAAAVSFLAVTNVGNRTMELHQVRYFLAMCKALNFTRAAEQCNVTQPSLTRAIKQLEEELGGPLFHRERANTHLTELGRIVTPYLKDLYNQSLEAKRKAMDFTKLTRTVLKVGVMCTIAPGNLLALVRHVRKRHPGIELHIIDASPAILHDKLISGELEVAISCQPTPELDDKLHCQPLYREQFMIVLSPQHPLADRNAIRVSDLKGEFYLERTHCEYHETAQRVFDQQGVTGETVYRSERDDWILAMAAAGLGYAFMPEHCARHPDVAARPLIDPEMWREIRLVTVRGRPHSAAVGAFVKEAVRMGRKEEIGERIASPFDRGTYAN
jgi:DNA-binding transcriptional LysR family regulator